MKTSILNSVLCNYNDACIIAKETVTVEITARAGAVSNNNKKVFFKNCKNEPALNDSNIADFK